MANNDGERQESHEPKDKERLRAAQFETISEVSSSGLQGSLYIVLMNGAVLFGVISLVKDYKDTALVSGIGTNLGVLIRSSLIAIASYYTFATSNVFSSLLKIHIISDNKIGIKIWLTSWLISSVIGIILVASSLAVFGYGVLKLSGRISILQ
jgi:hypothetical protein